MTEKNIPRLSSLYVYASGACNLNCAHCWINPRFQENPAEAGSLHVSIDLIEKAINQGKPLGLRSVKLTGGEPLLNPKFKEIVTLISNNDLRIVIESNGTLIDKEMAEFLASTKNFKFISISLDGADAATHEELRRVEGSFDSAVNGIRNLVEAGIHPQMICTLHRNNIHQLEETIALAKVLECSSIKFNHVQHVGRGTDFKSELGLTVPEIIDLNRKLEEEIIPEAGILVLLDVPLAFQSPARMLRSTIGKCNVLNIIGLLSTGDLALCGIGTSVKELVYGNLYTDNLEDVWKNSPKLMKLRDIVPDKLEGICSGCVHRVFCKGSCVANNYFNSGRLNAPYFFCHSAEERGLFPKSRMSIDKS